MLAGASGGLQDCLQAGARGGLGRLEQAQAQPGDDDQVRAQAGVEGPPPTLPKTRVSAQRLCDGASHAPCRPAAEAGQEPQLSSGAAKRRHLENFISEFELQQMCRSLSKACLEAMTSSVKQENW